MDEDLAPVGGVGLALDHVELLKRGEDGAHGLRTHALGAGEVGGGGGAVPGETLEDCRLGPGQGVGGAGGADAADEQADGVGEVGDGGV